MATKITGLSKMNVRALRETVVEHQNFHFVTLTATTATFSVSAQDALRHIEAVIASLPGRAHPKASLYAVARKLRAQVLNGRQDVPAQPLEHSVTPNLDRVLFGGHATPAPVLCPNSGITQPGRRLLYGFCKDCGKQGKVTSTGVLRAHKPLESTLENLLTY